MSSSAVRTRLHVLMSSVCRLQMLYFASVANDTAHIAKVVARQRSSKKTGRPHLVNTQMRVKPAAPLVLNGEIYSMFESVCSSVSVHISETHTTSISGWLLLAERLNSNEYRIMQGVETLHVTTFVRLRFHCSGKEIKHCNYGKKLARYFRPQ